MGFNLGMGLVAARSYGEADDARILREQERARFAYEQQLRDADLSTLPSQTDARRADLGLRIATSTAGTANVPRVAAATGAQADLATDQANASRVNVPAVAAATGSAADLANDTNLANRALLPGQAENTQLQQRLAGSELRSGLDAAPFNNEKRAAEARFGAGMANAQLDQMPALIYKAAVAGEIDKAQTGQIVAGTLGRYIQAQDKAGALKFINDLAAQGHPWGGEQTTSKVVDLAPGDNGGQQGYNITHDDGKVTWLPASSIADGLHSMRQGKWTMAHTPQGGIYMGNELTGDVKTAVQPTGTGLHNVNQHTPADIQKAQWLIDNRVAKSPTEAFAMVRSALEKTRKAFILDYTTKNGMGMDAAKVQRDAEAIYDRVTAQEKGGTQPGSNTSAPGTVPKAPPRIGAAIGLPPP